MPKGCVKKRKCLHLQNVNGIRRHYIVGWQRAGISAFLFPHRHAGLHNFSSAWALFSWHCLRSQLGAFCALVYQVHATVSPVHAIETMIEYFGIHRRYFVQSISAVAMLRTERRLTGACRTGSVEVLLCSVVETMEGLFGPRTTGATQWFPMIYTTMRYSAGYWYKGNIYE